MSLKDSVGSLPGVWAAAAERVTRDLEVGFDEPIDLQGLKWTSERFGSDLTLGLVPVVEGSSFVGFRVGRGYRFDESDLAFATAALAGLVQDELAGYEFRQWPVAGGQSRPLAPEVSDGVAVWAMADGVVYGLIGELRSAVYPQ